MRPGYWYVKGNSGEGLANWWADDGWGWDTYDHLPKVDDLFDWLKPDHYTSSDKMEDSLTVKGLALPKEYTINEETELHT